ncbi:MAG: VWA domain-containing protein [Deltaproteobacteria bacterium]|nr:VWA domain-containing protein [Deltaproteobacteria bacterium]MBN2670638.1 VWA domain-containing protein [Deltaproteobacteria bacterium]
MKQVDRNTMVLGMALVVLALGGCHSMKLELVDASVQKPSNVAVYFSMDDSKGEPVPGVEASQFKIYEDGQLISEYESKQTILNPEVAIERYTLLLLDMSGSVVDSGQVPQVQEAVGAFLENIDANEKIAIYAFDGRKEIQPIAKFGMREAALERRNELLSSYEPKDPSTNLNGAVIEAVAELDKAKEKSKVPLRFGTLVIFTDGTDRAHRATSDEAMNALEENDVTTFVIGLGGEVDSAQMEKYGKDGFILAENTDAIDEAFKEMAEKINAHALRYYLLSYCSPSRAGNHELTIEVEANEQRGRLRYEFEAEGFEPECDPTDAPKFEIPDEADRQPETNHRFRFGQGHDDEDDQANDENGNGKKKKKKKASNSDTPPAVEY